MHSEGRKSQALRLKELYLCIKNNIEVSKHPRTDKPISWQNIFCTVDVGCTGSRIKIWIWNDFTILIFISLYRLVLDFILMNQLHLINIKNKNMKEHFSDSCSFLISDVIMTILLRHLLWLTIKLYPSKMTMFISGTWYLQVKSLL